MQLIDKIEQLRQEAGITKRAISSKADITPEYYSLLIAGKSRASIVIIEHLAHAVNYELIIVRKWE